MSTNSTPYKRRYIGTEEGTLSDFTPTPQVAPVCNLRCCSLGGSTPEGTWDDWIRKYVQLLDENDPATRTHALKRTCLKLNPYDPLRLATSWSAVYTAVVRVKLPPRVVVLDLDETAGSFAKGSLAFKMFHKFTGKAPPIQTFVDHYLNQGGARQFLDDLLKQLEGWKRIGRIDEVAIFTAARNADGWVTYLKECIELYAGTPGLFDTVLSREDSERNTPGRLGERTVKDLSLVSADPEHVVLIDDKPLYVKNATVIDLRPVSPDAKPVDDTCIYGLNGTVIAVPEYKWDVNMDWLQTEIPTYAYAIGSILTKDKAKHPTVNALDQSADGALLSVSQRLKLIFPEIDPLRNEVLEHHSQWCACNLCLSK